MNPIDFTNQFSLIESPIKGVRLPEIKIEPRHRKELCVADNCTNTDFLRALCKKGFLQLGFKKDSKEYNEYAARVKYELGILNELGFVDYILLVWDVVNFCKEQNIPTGPGRGSAAGSLVLFLIGVTKIDSVKHGLYFERFVSKTRAKKSIIDGITYLDGSLMPDIDVDFDYYQRSKVLEYVDTKYKGKTSKILTLNSLSSKLCIKEVGKVLGMKTEEEMSMVTSMIPKTHGIVAGIKESVYGLKDDKDEKKEKWKIAPTQELQDWFNENPLVLDTAIKLENLIKNKGVHPSGILISFDTLEDCCPTELSSDKDAVSGYDMNWVSLFTVKFLSLTTAANPWVSNPKILTLTTYLFIVACKTSSSLMDFFKSKLM
jgi:DNA polymerase III subunit alpha